MYFCQYCGKEVTYHSTPTRGAWYTRQGRVCGVTDEGMTFVHMPFFDLETKEWMKFESTEEFEPFWQEASREPDWRRDAL